MERKTLVINAYERGFQKLYLSSKVDEYKTTIAEECLLDHYNHIVLDITACRLGYPSTPQFIDLVLEHLAKQSGEKSLLIKMGCISYFEWVCLNIIVLEGVFFGVKEKLSSMDDLNQVKEKVNQKLRSSNIVMTVELDNDENTFFSYGEKDDE
jgi:hypothetical protein